MSFLDANSELHGHTYQGVEALGGIEDVLVILLIEQVVSLNIGRKPWEELVADGCSQIVHGIGTFSLDCLAPLFELVVQSDAQILDGLQAGTPVQGHFGV